VSDGIAMFSTPDLCDANPDVLVLDLVLHNYGGQCVFGGAVATLQCFEDNSLVRAMLGEPGAGRVLVVDGGGSLRRALLGDQLADLAVANGWSGVLVNGAVRDVEQLRTCSLGVQAVGVCPRKSEKRGLGQRDVPLRFGGATITPSSWLYADANGVLISETRLH